MDGVMKSVGAQVGGIGTVMGTKVGTFMKKAEAAKVLTYDELEEIIEYLNYFERFIKAFDEVVTDSINTFNNTPVVQNFYKSGTFGKEMEDELLKIKNAVAKYYTELSSSGGLIERTKIVINSQMDLVMKGGN